MFMVLHSAKQFINLSHLEQLPYFANRKKMNREELPYEKTRVFSFPVIASKQFLVTTMINGSNGTIRLLANCFAALKLMCFFGVTHLLRSFSLDSSAIWKIHFFSLLLDTSDMIYRLREKLLFPYMHDIHDANDRNLVLIAFLPFFFFTNDYLGKKWGQLKVKISI